MYNVVVYDVFNNVHTYLVETRNLAHEYAKRIIIEGLWYYEEEGEEEVEIFLPVHEIVKVKVKKNV